MVPNPGDIPVSWMAFVFVYPKQQQRCSDFDQLTTLCSNWLVNVAFICSCPYTRPQKCEQGLAVNYEILFPFKNQTAQKNEQLNIHRHDKYDLK